jgi:hypothetical protein
MQKLFVQLNVLNNPMKHWSNGACWEMENCMCEQNLKKLKILWLSKEFTKKCS